MPDQEIRAASLEYHRQHPPGKISVQPTKHLTNQRDLALAYTPGVGHQYKIVPTGAGPTRKPSTFTYQWPGARFSSSWNGTKAFGKSTPISTGVSGEIASPPYAYITRMSPAVFHGYEERLLPG